MNAQPSQLSFYDYWKPLAITLALAFLYYATLHKLARDWWDDPNYSHGLLVPLIIGYILWSESARLRRVPNRPLTIFGGALILAGIAALWAGVAGAELFMQRASLIVMLAGLVIYFFGAAMLRAVFVPLVLVALAIPIPSIIFNKIAFPLQLFASRCAVEAMRFFDIPVLRDGNIIELMPLGATTPKKLEVVEACSGIRSLMTLVTLAVVFAYFTHGGGNNPRAGDDARNGDTRANEDAHKTFGWLTDYHFWRSTLLVLSAFPIAILTNALRVSGTGVLAHYYGTQVADGFFHSFSGWVVYVLAFLLLFATAWVLDWAFGLLRRKNKQSRSQINSPIQSPTISTLKETTATPLPISNAGREAN